MSFVPFMATSIAPTLRNGSTVVFPSCPSVLRKIIDGFSGLIVCERGLNFRTELTSTTSPNFLDITFSGSDNAAVCVPWLLASATDIVSGVSAPSDHNMASSAASSTKTLLGVVLMLFRDGAVGLSKNRLRVSLIRCSAISVSPSADNILTVDIGNIFRIYFGFKCRELSCADSRPRKRAANLNRH